MMQGNKSLAGMKLFVKEIFCRMLNNSMAAIKKFSLAFCLTAITNEPLELCM
jgi:hypothetical protein